MDALFLAADLTGLSTGVTALIVSFIVISLIFVGARYIRKAGVR